MCGLRPRLRRRGGKAMTQLRKTASGLSRRTFIRGTGTVIAGFTIIPRHVLGGAGFVAPREEVKSVDAILCATPDHLHAYVSVTAMRLKKHVYCEKPLTHNVWEARQVARVARETGVATQMGNQGHSGDFIRQTCELIWDGAI